jgi:hypothetical protein
MVCKVPTTERLSECFSDADERFPQGNRVVLAPIFLEYISDAFAEGYAKLAADRGEEADAEDPDEYRAVGGRTGKSTICTAINCPSQSTFHPVCHPPSQ